MSVSLRKSLQTSVPQTQFGPFRLLLALPWLVLAAAMRVIAFGGGAVALPAIIVANLAVLQAFLATATHSIEAEGGQTGLGEVRSVVSVRGQVNRGVDSSPFRY